MMQRLCLRLIYCMLLVAAPGLSRADTLRVFVSAKGNDRNDGRSLENAVATLKKAQDVARASWNGRDDVKILIDQGNYSGQQVRWDWLPTGRPLVITALNREKGRPVFDGLNQRGPWLRLVAETGAPSLVTISGLEFRHYFNAITIDGDRLNLDRWNGQNTITDNKFFNVGSPTTPRPYSPVSAIVLVNSRNNLIDNNDFFMDFKTHSCPGHSLYIAYSSIENSISHNTFDGTCAAAIKIKDRSGRNTIKENRFLRLGRNVAMVDSFCDRDQREDCTKLSRECPSWDNQFMNNTLDTGDRTRPRSTIALGHNSIEGCPAPGSARIREQ